jgi:hypothetical protein
MKKMRNIIISGLVGLALSGCNKNDNYTAPNDTLTGTIIDATTGKALQTANGDTRLYVLETSYKATSNPIPQYFNVQQDGTFNNSKVFGGTYKLYPTDGPFVPLVYTDATGTIVDNGSKTVQVGNGTTTVGFTVTPFLTVSFVGEPVLNADNTVTVNCKFERGTNDPTRQFNVTDVFLFISSTPFVSNGAYDNTISKDVLYTGTAGNALLGQTVTITSIAPLGTHRPYWVRIGARTADNVNKRYNYTDVKQVNVP